MTEKEKRDKGELYDANYDKVLEEERIAVKDLCFKYNNLKPSKKEERKKLIKEILGETKENLLIESNFYCDYGYNISVGENFYMNHNCVILDGARVTFGDNVVIGAGSVVTKDVTSNTIAYGNPCKIK